MLDYIREHNREELSLEALAWIAAFSPFHFHRIFARAFKERFGMTASEWRAGGWRAQGRARGSQDAHSGWQAG
jgi:AraC-like DNA-binding protein